MTRTLTVLAAAGAIAAATVAAPSTAEARHGSRIATDSISNTVGAPFYYYGARGGYYGGPYVAYVPSYDYGPACYWQRERFRDGRGWHVRRVQVCP